LVGHHKTPLRLFPGNLETKGAWILKNPGPRKDSCAGQSGISTVGVTKWGKPVAETAGINRLFLSLYFFGHALRYAIAVPKLNPFIFNEPRIGDPMPNAKLGFLRNFLTKGRQ
jgi:hypothetical protein